MRAAHSLAADPSVDSVVVVGPAKSRSFQVVEDPSDCDVLIGTGEDAPTRASSFGIPLVWDGLTPAPGVAVWGASTPGLAAALADRERRVAVAAAADPNLPAGSGQTVRFARPVGATQVEPVDLGGNRVLIGKSYNEYGACLVRSKSRRLAVVDHAAFLAGIALAAGIAVFKQGPGPVWDQALTYLEIATGMGLVLAES